MDAHGLPLAVDLFAANWQEHSLVQPTLQSSPALLHSSRRPHSVHQPLNLVGDRSFAYPYLGHALMKKYCIRLIAKERGKRSKANYITGHSRAERWQDGRRQRRCSRRWIVERFFAFLRNFRRLICRWEYYPENYLGFVRLACSLLLLNHF